MRNSVYPAAPPRVRGRKEPTDKTPSTPRNTKEEISWRPWRLLCLFERGKHENHRREIDSPAWRDPRYRMAGRHRPGRADEHPARDPFRRRARWHRVVLYQSRIRRGVADAPQADARRRDRVRSRAGERKVAATHVLVRPRRGSRTHH